MADDKKDTIGKLSDFAILAERLKIKNDSKDTKELSKNIETLNKSILSFAKKVLPKSELGNTIGDVSRSRKTFDPISEMIRARLFPKERSLKEKFGGMRSTLNTLGVVKKDSGGLFDKLLERREVKNQFITDQLKVNPQMTDTKANREIFGKKFDQQQRIQKELNQYSGEIERLKEGGFTEKQIARSGLVKKRDGAAARLAASDNRLYETIKDEMAESIKEGLVDGIKDAAKEAERKLNKLEKGRKEDVNPLRSQEEIEREDDIIQEGILKAQNELVDGVKRIHDLLDRPTKEEPEKDEKTWLGRMLDTISGFFLGKITGLVGMLTAGISAVLSPILRFLGIGKAASAASTIGKTVGGAAAGAAATKTGGLLGKAKGMIKSALPALGNVAKIAGTALLSKPALIAATVAGAGYMGWQMLPDDVKENVEGKISSIFGNDDEQPKLAKKSSDTRIAKIERADIADVGEALEQKAKELQSIKASNDSSTLVNAPSNTVNNQNSVVNNHFKQPPRNSEPSINRYFNSRFSLA